MSVLDTTQEQAPNRPTRAPRAALYLRVSSPRQVKTDYDPEGLSLPSQREHCQRKARELGAEIVREYIEPGVSAKSLIHRKAFKQMIEDIRELRDIDYVIVWSISRWARNQEDHWTARGLVKRVGAKLISVKEPIGEDTSHGVMIEGVMAAVAESRLIEISEDVTRSMQRMVEVGGKPGPAPLGYFNRRESLPGGGDVGVILVDDTRAPIIAWGFETYASGLYSLLDIVTLFEARGLLTRGNARYSPRPLRLSAVHAMLSNPFYAGKVRYKGKLYKGRHEAIISEELFDKVKAVLEAHNLSGERDRKHQHYLKGTIRCGLCDHRLTYSLNKGNGGGYSYFICAPSQRHECSCGYLRMEEVEAKIEEHYRSISLHTGTRDRVMALIEQRLSALATTSKQEIQRCESLLAGLMEEERKLLAKHYTDEISKELYSEEAERIKRERSSAQTIVDRLQVSYDELQLFLAMALRLATSSLHDLYLRAKPHVRRLMNQSIFEVIWAEPDEDRQVTVRSKLATPFAELAAIQAIVEKIDRTARETDDEALEPVLAAVGAPESAKVPDFSGTLGNLAAGSISEVMVGRVGIEPTTLGLRGPCSAG